MSEFFAKISGQFTGPILLSALFPVLLFLTGLTLVVLPLTPYGQGFTEVVQNSAAWQKTPLAVLVLTVFILVLSVVLFNMNTAIVRLYEGYPWQKAWIAKPFLRRRRRDFRLATVLRQRIITLRRQLRLSGIVADLNKARETQNQVAGIINGKYPDREDLVLPTRLGNVIRAFETYTTRQYGMPAIALWPRLQALVDGNLATALDGAKTAFDFMIHTAFLSAVLTVFTASAGLFWKTRALHDLQQPWLGWTIIFAVISYLFYLASIPRAIEWGTQVKSAFDLYRLKLLTQLGYELKPTDLTDERRIWENLNYKFAFPDGRRYPVLPYQLPESYILVDPPSTIVTSKRSVDLQDTGIVQITLIVSNSDPSASNAERVIVREVIPTGKTYVKDSARLDGNPPPMFLSLEPLQIDLGPLLYKSSRTIVYRIAKAA
jgi:hypothetical protein